MRLWPRKTPEKRVSDSRVKESYAYHQLAKLNRATGSPLVGQPGTADAQALGAVEVAAGIYGRAFALARLPTLGDAVAGALPPAVLELIGRELIRAGEVLFRIDVRGGRLRLLPASSWNLHGDTPDPMDWRYQLTTSGPSSTRTQFLGAESVVHIRIGASSRSPWRGRSPIEIGGLTAALAATLETRAAEELSGPVGQIVVTNSETGAPGLETSERITAASRFNLMRGGVAARSAQRDGLSDVGGKAASSAWGSTHRLGPNPPASIAQLREQNFRHVLALAGIPPEMATGEGAGGAAREAQRRWIAGGLAALGRIAAAELSAKLEVDIALNFDALAQTDIQQRSRALSLMVQAGIEVAEARRLAGLD